MYEKMQARMMAVAATITGDRSPGLELKRCRYQEVFGNLGQREGPGVLQKSAGKGRKGSSFHRLPGRLEAPSQSLFCTPWLHGAQFSAWCWHGMRTSWCCPKPEKPSGWTSAGSSSQAFCKYCCHCCRPLLAGAAPISRETLEYFGQLGMMIQNAPGLQC